MTGGDDTTDEPTQPEIPPPVNLPPPVDAPAPAPAAQPITAPPASAAPVAAKTPLLDRTQWIVMAVGVVVVIVLAAAIIVFSNNNDNNAAVSVVNTPLPAAAAPTVAATDAPVTAPPTTVVQLKSVLSQLDAQLNESAAQVADLKNVIAQFAPTDQPCGLTAADAAAQTGTIIDKRTAMVSQLASLANTGDATARQLASLLHTAIDLSLQSDYPYRSWMSANASSDGTNPCARVHDSNWQDAQNLAPRAGDAKKAFVAAYDPVAAGLGLRANWTYQDF